MFINLFFADIFKVTYMKNPITYFEIPADDIEKTKKFYEKIFDWKIEKYDKDENKYYFVETTDVGEDEWTPVEPGAINGAIVKREDSNEKLIDYIEVDSIEEMQKKIEKNGGKMIKPKTKMGEWGWWATFKDPEGNEFGLYEEAE